MKTVSLGELALLVSAYFGVPVSDMLGQSRREFFCLPRHVCMYLGRHYTRLSMRQIADFFGRSDHTTVLNAERRIQRQIESDTYLKQQVEWLTNRIREREEVAAVGVSAAWIESAKRTTALAG